jgi:hypothetical protein
MYRPYLEVRKNREITRVFESNIDNRELKWHRDAKDRYVKVLESSGWSLQLENNLPVDLIEGISYFIEKDEWHRIIKGTGKLVLKIIEY